MGDKKIVLSVNVYKCISEIVEREVAYGYNRAYKHTDTPSEAQMCNEIETAVMNGLCEAIDFDRSGVIGDDPGENYRLAVRIYEARGYSGVFDAVHDGILTCDGWERCEPCEMETPHEGGACLVCGSSKPGEGGQSEGIEK